MAKQKRNTGSGSSATAATGKSDRGATATKATASAASAPKKPAKHTSRSRSTKASASSSTNLQRGRGGQSSPYHEAATLVTKVLGLSTGSGSGSTSSGTSSIKPKSIKSVVYDKKGVLTCSKRSYAVTTKVVQHYGVIQAALSSVPSLQANCHSTGLLYVLLYEYLVSPQQKMAGGGAVKRLIASHETALRKSVDDYYKQHPHLQQLDNESTTASKNNSSFPRYIRVNTCLTTAKDVVKQLQTMLSSSSQPSSSQPEIDKLIQADAHVPDLLVVAPSLTSRILAHFNPTTTTDTQATQHNRRHAIVLQDKSSCFSALCLVDLLLSNSRNRNGNLGDILDACAAPGNKTSHVAALLAKYGNGKNAAPNKTKSSKASLSSSDATNTTNTTTIYALDRDDKRCQLLQRRMTDLVPPLPIPTANSNSNNKTTVVVEVQHQDFLATNPADYSTVTAILLDPSCSGSGLYQRDQHDGIVAATIAAASATNTTTDEQDNVNDTDNSAAAVVVDDRLTKLSNFQITALRHAMSFANVHTIVYSTCSIHAMENEHVVASALHNVHENGDNDNDDNGARGEWQLVAPPSLSQWTRRGQGSAVADAKADGLDDEDTTEIDRTPDAQSLLSPAELQCLIRANEHNQTNGFFVACLQRKTVATKLSSTRAYPERTSNMKSMIRNTNLDLGLPIFSGTRFWSQTDRGSSSSAPSKPLTATKAAPRKKSQSAESSAAATGTKVKDTSPHSKLAQQTKMPRPVANRDSNGLDDAATGGNDDDTTERVDGGGRANNGVAASSAKKRAKAVEWKRRQQQAKRARVKSK